MRPRHLAWVAAGMGLLSVRPSRADDFSYNPPGQLVAGSGSGRADEMVYAPGMRFPIEEGPAFANSQVWGHGGSSGPGGDQCDVENFSYPWWDNYCETRSWDMPLCPAGVGHQGQDIRASSCEKNVHWVVAAESGTVTSIGSYSVYITAADGTRYDYLHMGSVQVAVGEDVQKGQHIGKVSNEFGGTSTTVHLHFNLRQDVSGVGNVYVPPYKSLIAAYQQLIGPPVDPPQGALEQTGCEALAGYAISAADPASPIDVRFYFDGTAGDGSTVGHPFLAGLSRADLCEGDDPATCEHGFQVPPPLSLFDGAAHTVHAYAADGVNDPLELAMSPAPLQCSFELPKGNKRKVASADSANAWRFSPFWDELVVSDGVLASVPEGAPWQQAPRLVATADHPEALFVIDGDVRRSAGDEISSWIAWDLAPIFAEVISQEELDAFQEGPPLPSRPIVLASATGELWVVDADPAAVPSGEGGGGGSGAGGGDAVDDDGSEGCACSLGERREGSPLGLALMVALGLRACRSRRKTLAR